MNPERTKCSQIREYLSKNEIFVSLTNLTGQLCDDLDQRFFLTMPYFVVPGRVDELHVISSKSDDRYLYWLPPCHHFECVDKYIVQQFDYSTKERITIYTENLNVLVNVKPCQMQRFKVSAMNSYSHAGDPVEIDYVYLQRGIVFGACPGWPYVAKMPGRACLLKNIGTPWTDTDMQFEQVASSCSLLAFVLKFRICRIILGSLFPCMREFSGVAQSNVLIVDSSLY